MKTADTSLRDIRSFRVGDELFAQERSRRRAALLEMLARRTPHGDESRFYRSVAESLTWALGVDACVLAVRNGSDSRRMDVVARQHRGQFRRPMRLAAVHPLLRDVMLDGTLLLIRGAGEAYGRTPLFEREAFEGFYGIALRNEQGQAFGVLAVFDEHALGLDQDDRSLLNLFAARLGSEIIHQRHCAGLAAQIERQHFRVVGGRDLQPVEATETATLAARLDLSAAIAASLDAVRAEQAAELPPVELQAGMRVDGPVQPLLPLVDLLVRELLIMAQAKGALSLRFSGYEEDGMFVLQACLLAPPAPCPAGSPAPLPGSPLADGMAAARELGGLLWRSGDELAGHYCLQLSLPA